MNLFLTIWNPISHETPYISKYETPYISNFTLHRFLFVALTQCKIQNEISEFKISKLELSRSSQRLQNNASSHYPTTIFTQWIFFLQYETPLFRAHVFRTRRLIHMQSLSWLQNLNFKLGALRHEKRRGLAFYTITSCLKCICHLWCFFIFRIYLSFWYT